MDIRRIKPLDYFGTDAYYRTQRLKDKQDEIINKINRIIEVVNQLTEGVTNCTHNHFSDMVKTKKGYELHCSNCGFNYGLLGQERRNENADE